MLKIKLLRISDYKSIVEWQKRVWGENIKVSLERDLFPILKADCSFGVFQGDDLIGALISLILPGDVYYMHMLGIVPEFRGRGVAYELFKYSEKHAVSLKMKEIQLTSDPKDIRNINFYLEKNHMHVCDYIPNIYSTEFDKDTDRFLYKKFLNEKNIIKEKVSPKFLLARGEKDNIVLENSLGVELPLNFEAEENDVWVSFNSNIYPKLIKKGFIGTNIFNGKGKSFIVFRKIKP